MSDWREAKKEMNRAGRFGIGWVIAILVIVALIGAAFWGISVLTSAPKGIGDAVVKKNSSSNWTAAQARFEDMFQDVLATDKKITVAATALALDPDDKTLQANFTGTTNYCISVVGDYNAEARKFLSQEFRAADLPDQIDDRDSATDCKEEK